MSEVCVIILQMNTPPPNLELVLEPYNNARQKAYGDSPTGPTIEQLTNFAAVAALAELTEQVNKLTQATVDQTQKIGQLLESLYAVMNREN